MFNKYHSRVPFVKQLMYSVMERAQDAGRIRTVLGRRCRFNLWEPNEFGINKALPYEDALREYGAWRGIIMAARRISRCHPWHEGGYDPVPLKNQEDV